MTRADALRLGRESTRAQAWANAFECFSLADREAPLDAADIALFANAAHLTGHEAESGELLVRAHQAFLNIGETGQAVRCTVWLCMHLMFSGEPARAGGWLARGRRLMEGQPESVEQGYLLLPEAQRDFFSGNAAAAYETFRRCSSLGERFSDRDLIAMARHGEGRALIRLGDRVQGVTFLDEAMVSVTSGEVSPILAGTIYCSVIASCHETLDLRRAREWTSALLQWCSSQGDSIPFRGTCLLHRAEVLQFRGEWPESLDEARRACERLSQPSPKPGLGSAFYRTAELHRLRGNFAAAEEGYREASQLGYIPQPGLALLRLAQAQLESANAAIRAAGNDAQEPLHRAEMLAAFVEIVLADQDVAAAGAAAEELAVMANDHGASLLQAMSATANGAVLLARQDSGAALSLLRRGWNLWCELDVPYEAARARVLIARACLQQGDRDTAELELTAARAVFEQLGAATDLAGLSSISREAAGVSHAGVSQTTGPNGTLSSREAEVLKLVASGATNRAIAETLGISDKTVARHVSNIFVKLDLSSRAAATAYAYRNGLA